VVGQVPNARVFDDFGSAALGLPGKRLVYGTIYTAILLNPVLLHLTSAEALEHSFPEQRFHPIVAPVIVAILMAPLAQASLPRVCPRRCVASGPHV
jgi:vesicular inhibitory amino acid transporter